MHPGISPDNGERYCYSTSHEGVTLQWFDRQAGICLDGFQGGSFLHPPRMTTHPQCRSVHCFLFLVLCESLTSLNTALCLFCFRIVNIDLVSAFVVDYSDYRIYFPNSTQNTMLSAYLDGSDVTDIRQKVQKAEFILIKSMVSVRKGEVLLIWSLEVLRCPRVPNRKSFSEVGAKKKCLLKD